MRRHDYDTDYDKNTGNTETHRAVDEKIKNTIRDGSTKGDRQAYEEGFGAESGIRPETSASGGRIKYPEAEDASKPDRVPQTIEKQNAGLADS